MVGLAAFAWLCLGRGPRPALILEAYFASALSRRRDVVTKQLVGVWLVIVCQVRAQTVGLAPRHWSPALLLRQRTQ